MNAALRGANLALAFLLELAMLAAFAVAGWAATDVFWLRIVLAIGLPGIAIVLWAVWAAPRSDRRLKGRALLAFEIIMFGLATAAFWAAGQSLAAVIFGGLAVINLSLAQVFGQS